MVAFFFLFSCEKNEQNNPVPDNFFPLWSKFKDCQMSIYRWWSTYIYMTKAIQKNDSLIWRKLHTFGEMPIEYEKQTVLSFMVNIPRLPNVYL